MGLLRNQGLIIKKAEFTYYYLNKIGISGDRAAFSDEESRHIARVCRAKAGDLLYATDGEGHLYRIEIDRVEKNAVAGRIVDATEHRAALAICELAIPVAAQQKTDWIIEKCTELGVTTFHLFGCSRSVAPGISQVRIERLRRIAISAIKQSMRPFLPRFRFHDNLDSLSGTFPDFDLVIYGDLGDRSRELRSVIVPRELARILILVGPEPGFSTDERRLLETAGAVPTRFGDHRLRMETAAVVLPAVAMELMRGHPECLERTDSGEES